MLPTAAGQLQGCVAAVNVAILQNNQKRLSTFYVKRKCTGNVQDVGTLRGRGTRPVPGGP